MSSLYLCSFQYLWWRYCSTQIRWGVDQSRYFHSTSESRIMHKLALHYLPICLSDELVLKAAHDVRLTSTVIKPACRYCGTSTLIYVYRAEDNLQIWSIRSLQKEQLALNLYLGPAQTQGGKYIIIMWIIRGSDNYFTSFTWTTGESLAAAQPFQSNDCLSMNCHPFVMCRMSVSEYLATYYGVSLKPIRPKLSLIICWLKHQKRNTMHSRAY